MTSIQSLVPTIDVSCHHEANLKSLDQACRTHGFFLLTGHGLDAIIEKTLATANLFFQQDRGHKSKIVRDQENPMGWYDRELTKGYRDHKEIFDFTDPVAPLGRERNKWPEEPADFQKILTDYHREFSLLATKTLKLVLMALALDKSVIDRYRGDAKISPVRLNKYLVEDPVPVAERAGLPPLGKTALGEHTDPGVLTLLLQDRVGGLQTKMANGQWIDIAPISGTIIVNLGDSLQVWSNDQYRAALHRVLPMEKSDRISIPFFYHPERNAVLEPIPEIAKGLSKYHAFKWLDYIKARDDDNFAEIGKADAQVSDYKINRQNPSE